MAEDDDDRGLDPESRYAQLGTFDAAYFEADLEGFSDYFDENGWPLFGDFDEYALEHPITGRSWHENPRVPTQDESDPDYETWFDLAGQFASLRSRLVELVQNTPIHPNDDPGGTDSLYRDVAPFAFAGNLGHLRDHHFNQLEEAFHRREATPEFLLLWGEFRAIAQSLEPAARISNTRNKGRGAKQPEPLLAQRKWYLHWIRHYKDKLGNTVQKANSDFITTALEIAEGRRQPPQGFDAQWFAQALRQEPDENGGRRAVRELPSYLKKARSYKHAAKLLKQAPSEGPLIPSVGRENYV